MRGEVVDHLPQKEWGAEEGPLPSLLMALPFTIPLACKAHCSPNFEAPFAHPTFFTFLIDWIQLLQW